MYEECSNEKELESQNTESNSKEEADEPTGDSISDEEDLLTTEIIPKWDELPEIPAPNVERADIEESKEFFIENFECLGSTPTDDKEEPVFFKPAETAPVSEPLPFEKNSFHRTSISARFIQRSKQSSVASTPSNQHDASQTTSNKENNILEQKNLELEKRREELESTRKRLEAMGFKSLDNWTKKHTVDTKTTEIKEEMPKIEVTEGTQTSNSDENKALIPSVKPSELIIETSQKNEPNNSYKDPAKESPSQDDAESSTKKASDLIAFFDARPKDKPSKAKTTNKSEKSQTRSKVDERKTRVKNDKVSSKTSQVNIISKDVEKIQKSQNRRSFPFNITKLTKTKSSDRRRSAPKTNLSKAKSCGDLLHEPANDETLEQKPRRLSELEDGQNNQDVSNAPAAESSITVDACLSELSAELTAALATPAPKLIEINLSRDYLMGNNDVTSAYRHCSSENEKAFSSEVTKNECQEVVVDLVRAFERALDCHSKILNGDIKDNQRQGLSMLSATFTTIHESITECKNEREKRLVRSPKVARIAGTNSEENAETKRVETQDTSQQTEHVLTSNEQEQIAPLLEKYSELLLKMLEEKLSMN